MSERIGTVPEVSFERYHLNRLRGQVCHAEGVYGESRVSRLGEDGTRRTRRYCRGSMPSTPAFARKTTCCCHWRPSGSTVLKQSLKASFNLVAKG